MFRGVRLGQATGWQGYVWALLFTAIVTAGIALLDRFTDVSGVSMLYLLAVMASAIVFGSGPAILASVAAFFAFNFFFIEPRYRLTVSHGEEWVALVLLLVTGVITGQLAAALRNRARDAELREREAIVLYDVVRLMASIDVSSALTAVAERLRRELDLPAVLIEIEDGALTPVRAESGADESLQIARASTTTAARVLREGDAPTAEERGSPGRWIKVVPPVRHTRTTRLDRLHVVPIAGQERPIGSLVLVRPERSRALGPADERLLSAVGSQLGLAAERARLREQATEAEVLRRSDELKTALLNAVSHELRTPLSSIVASAGSLLQDDVQWTDQERREFARAIEKEAERLDRLVGNLLDLSRIQTGSLVPERGWHDLGALVEEVLRRLRPLTSRHGLVVHVPDDLPQVSFGYIEIEQVLANLIENATKYAPPGTKIEVIAEKAQDSLRIEVADNGPGIPEAALARVFDPFYRAPSDGPRPAGTGLGLAVARGLVEAHGGTICAENRRGGGARFVFTLPVVSPERHPSTAA